MAGNFQSNFLKRFWLFEKCIFPADIMLRQSWGWKHFGFSLNANTFRIKMWELQATRVDSNQIYVDSLKFKKTMQVDTLMCSSTVDLYFGKRNHEQSVICSIGKADIDRQNICINHWHLFNVRASWGSTEMCV
jgi:hypothetical protein